MPLCKPIRLAALLSLSAVAAFAQSPPQPTSPPPAPAPTITFTQGKLAITADNASLNQILHLISVQTGMKITGGVTDERVFGSYGPATPSVVLTQLLQGTGSNILVVQAANTSTPTELILTPRNGGPSPPNPNADAERYSQSGTPNANRLPYNNPPRFPNSNPGMMQNRRMPPDSNSPSNGSSTVQPVPGSMPQSPNGVPTPQQLQLQQQRQQMIQQQNNQ